MGMNVQLRRKGEGPAKRIPAARGVLSGKRTDKAAAAPRNTSGAGGSVLCRESEYAVLRDRVESFLACGAGAVVYITGVPGSGKTHTVTKVLESVRRPFAHVNCAGLRRRALIFRAIGEGTDCETCGNTLQSLRAHFHTCERHHIIFVDEVDLLRTRTEGLLYNLFEMPFIAGARVLLIVASNTLGTLSTKIESRIGKDRLEFRPYTSADLCSILRHRAGEDGAACDGGRKLRKNNGPAAGSPQAPRSLELISKRVASSTGDVRRALELADRAKTADLREVDAIIRETAAPLLNRFVAALGYHQKLALYLNSDHTKNLIQWFHDFKAFCKIKDMPLLDFVGFRDCVDELARVGIFSVSGVRIGSSYHKEELERAMKGDPVFCGFFA